MERKKTYKMRKVRQLMKQQKEIVIKITFNNY